MIFQYQETFWGFLATYWYSLWRKLIKKSKDVGMILHLQIGRPTILLLTVSTSKQFLNKVQNGFKLTTVNMVSRGVFRLLLGD